MNTGMYLNPVHAKQSETVLVNSAGSLLTRLPEIWHAEISASVRCRNPQSLWNRSLHEIAFEKDMLGLKVLVTAGPTQESMDPVPLYHQPFIRENGLRSPREPQQGVAQKSHLSPEKSISRRPDSWM